MSNAELEEYARDGRLPLWFEQIVAGISVQAEERAGGSE
jgi:hypothetical protein